MNCGSGGGGFGNRNPSIASCFEITDVNTVWWVSIFISSMCLREFDLLISFSLFCVTIHNGVKILKNI